jgi:hypothetical protein
MISFVRAKAFSAPGMSAHSAPPAAPQTHIATIVAAVDTPGPSQIAIPSEHTAPR